MTIPTDQYVTYSAVGIREDLIDIIYDISPMDTPFMTMAGRKKATATYHEWQVDVLATAAVNAQIEGDTLARTAAVATTRRGNNLQISWKVPSVSGTLQAVSTAGRSNEMQYQVSKMSRELKRDMEVTLTQHQTRESGDAADARTSAGLENWFIENDFRAGDGADCDDTNGIPDETATVTDGTQRAFTEAMLQDAISAAWVDGGDPGVILCGPVNKRNISGFTGGSTRMDKGEDKRLTAAVDLYISDFGEHRIVPSRFSRDRTVFVLDMEYWNVAYLRPFQTIPTAKVNDADTTIVLAEYCLEACNQESSAVVADLTT